MYPLKNNIFKYYLFCFISKLDFSMPIGVLYLRSLHLNYTQILGIFVALAVAQVLFEVPSGIFADYFGRKKTIFIYSWLRVLPFVCLIFGYLPSHFILGGFLLGMSLAFESGTDSAFIYDTLVDLNQAKDYKKIEGKAFSFRLLGWAIGSFIGGFLAHFWLKLPIIMCLITFLSVPFIVLSFIEPRHHKQIGDTKYFHHLKEALNCTLTHMKISWLILFSGICMTLILIAFPLLQPYIQQTNMPVKYFGVIYTIWFLFSSVSARSAHHIYTRLGRNKSFLLMSIMLGVPFLLLSKLPFIFAWTFVLGIEFVFGYLRPVITDEINQLIESKNRATILSLKGFFQNIIFIICSPIMGWIADLYSIRTVFLIEGIFILVFGALIMLFLIRSTACKV